MISIYICQQIIKTKKHFLNIKIIKISNFLNAQKQKLNRQITFSLKTSCRNSKNKSSSNLIEVIQN